MGVYTTLPLWPEGWRPQRRERKREKERGVEEREEILALEKRGRGRDSSPPDIDRKSVV